MNAPLEYILSTLAPQLVPAFREEVADKTEVIGQQFAVYCWQIPAGQIGVDAIHEGGIVPHLQRQWAKQMPHSLLMLYVNVKVTHHYYSAIGANALFAATKLS